MHPDEKTIWWMRWNFVQVEIFGVKYFFGYLYKLNFQVTTSSLKKMLIVRIIKWKKTYLINREIYVIQIFFIFLY